MPKPKPNKSAKKIQKSLRKAAVHQAPALGHPEPRRRWTVMVYLAGDNNLTEECAFAISEMKLVKLSERVNVLVQFDPKGTNLPTQRFLITGPGEQGAGVKSTIVRQRNSHGSPYRLGETNTGSPRALYDFVAYGIQMFPAHSYIVVLAGHGGGVEDSFLLRDENPTGTLSLREMKLAFRAIKSDFQVEVDIIGLDTCLMSMAEVGYQLKDNAKILIGSEGYAPLGGWPYRPILQKISEMANASKIKDSEPPVSATLGSEYEDNLKSEREDVAKTIVCTHAAYYLPFVPGGVDVEQSALDLSRSDELANHIYRLGRRLKHRLAIKAEDRIPFTNALILAHWDAQSFNGEIYIDLRDFCCCLIVRMGNLDSELTDICGDIEREIGAQGHHCDKPGPTNAPARYVLRSCYTGPTFQYAHGVSIYFPWYEVIPYYEDLDFAQTTKWHEFLEAYVVATRRQPRPNGPTILGDKESTLPIRQSSGKQSSGKYDRPIIRSMRNAPISLDGLSRCFNREDPEIIDIFKGL